MSKRTKARGYHGYYEGKIEEEKPSVKVLAAVQDILALCDERNPEELNVSVFALSLAKRLGCGPFEASAKWAHAQKFLMKQFKCETLRDLCIEVRAHNQMVHLASQIKDGDNQYWVNSQFGVHRKEWIHTFIQIQQGDSKRVMYPDHPDNVVDFPSGNLGA